MTLNIEKLAIVTDEKSRNYLREAYDVAWGRSKDSSTKVGAYLIRDDFLIGRGFNHLTQGVENIAEWKEKPLKYKGTVHAEIDVITQAAKFGVATNRSTMYMPWLPCTNCYLAMKNAGIETLVAHKQFIEMSPPHWEDDLNLIVFLAEKDNFKIVLYDGKIGSVKSLFNGQIWEP
jgi:dCMP deaminase